MKLLLADPRSAARAALGSILVALAAGSACAQSLPSPTAKPCESSEHRQFDFWVGHWEVFGPAGKKVGENRIEAIADGCALLEQWSGNGGVTGKSLNIYDTSDRRWHQTWVDSGGTLLILAGGLVDGSMVMRSPESAPELQRITWMPNADGSVRQLWESSSDRGSSWTVLFDGRYVRAR